MVDFQDVIRVIDRFAIYDLFLPFLLLFIIFYILAGQIKLFKEQKNQQTILALVISLITVVPHILGKYPKCYDPILIMKDAIPNVSIVIVGIVFFIIILGIIGIKGVFDTFQGLFALIAFFFILYTFLASADSACFGGRLTDSVIDIAALGVLIGGLFFVFSWLLRKKT